MDHQSFFSAVRAKKLARTAPEMLCHTENTAPGMVASGYCAKWAAAREVAPMNIKSKNISRKYLGI